MHIFSTISSVEQLRRRVGGNVTAQEQHFNNTVETTATPTDSSTNTTKTKDNKMHNSGNNSIDGTSSSGGGATGTYGMTPEQASREFDVLRREATKLERHLEDRVARYQQVSSVCL